ncbi:hypothetical protein AMATHDRAFT_54504 [Amanita thiersii Skay4041]|uniref:HIG1 domain-containing protein n=1 Tax=Amanita thiersii Skay4041 TaxID=703135 RepID=A0A2A9NVP9_9AGAR|nr:hypothetical protein AMATHDRAFT_54504 [Amanita thiersii Skay4041]
MSLFPPDRRDVPPMETYREKAVRKFKENPLVPLGALATVAALVVASVKMKRGESQKLNHWLRVRVAAQGFTVLAVCAGTYAYRKRERDAVAVNDIEKLPRNEADVETHRQQKLEKERREFEERLKDAEEAHRLETQDGSIASRKEMALSTGVNPGESNNSRKGWFSWLGLNK